MIGAVHILLIEDNAGDAELIQEMLSLQKGASYEFACVKSLTSALNVFNIIMPDIILLNLKLPDSNGVENVEAIRAAAPGIPCVVLTDEDDRNLGLAAVKAGAQDFLVKGAVSGDLLFRVVHYAIERTETQRQVRESESILRSALDSLTSHIAIIDQNGCIVRVNHAWRQFARKNDLGMENDGEGANYFEICKNARGEGEENAREFLAGVRQVLSGEKLTFQMEYPCHGPNERSWFVGRVTRFHEKTGLPWIVIAHEDITESKYAAMALQASEQQLQAVFDTTPNSVLLKDVQGRYFKVNKAVQRFYGVAEADICGKTDQDLADIFLLGPDDIQRHVEQDERVREKNCPMLLPVQSYVDCRGRVHWLKGVKAPLELPDLPGCVLTIRIDVTEHHKVEVESRNAEIRLRTILDNLKDRVVLLDTDLRVIWPNKVACDEANMTREEIIGENYYDVWKAKNDVCDSCPIKLAMATLAVKSANRTLSDDRTVRITGCPVFDADGELVGVVEVAEDISERVRREGKVRQSQKMESLGTLAGGIAHDFNNILTAILGFTELCLSRAEVDSEEHEDLTEVYQAGVRAKDLVSQILTFSRRAETDRQLFQPRPVIKEALKLLRSTLPTSIEFRQYLDDSEKLIFADPTQIHQIVMNLCTNAAHAMEPEGGVLELRVDEFIPDADLRVNSSILSPGSYFRLRIRDTGCGMSPEVISSIFDPYFTTKELGEGTGLGLSVVHGIVTESGGDILVDSEIGKGSEFTVLLPLVEDVEDVNLHWQSEEGSLPEGNEQILVVDDEVPILSMTRRIFEQYGYGVDVSNDPVDALEKIRKEPKKYDIVLSDVTMPKLMGDKLAEKIKEIRKDLPVILMTGYSNFVTEELAEQKGAMAIIYKPLGRATLARLIRKYLDQSASMRRQGEMST